MSMLHELLKKKKPDKTLDPAYKKAKMGVLKDIHDMANGDMGEELKGMKKVTVASPDEEGLKVGLDKAKQMVDEHADDLEKDDPAMAHKDDEESKGHQTVHGDDMMDPATDGADEAEDTHLDDEADDHLPHAGSNKGEHGPGAPKAEDLIAGQINHEASEDDMSDDEIEELINLLQSKRKKS